MKYRIETKQKKCINEWEYYESETSDVRISVETLWRGGAFIINLQPDERLPDEANEYGFDLDDYEDWELDYTWDGCGLDIHVDSKSGEPLEDEVREEFLEALEENEDLFTWLDENGFYTEYCTYELAGELLITPVDDD